jgi:hypothetical protein
MNATNSAIVKEAQALLSEKLNSWKHEIALPA